MTRLILIRHSITEANEKRLYCGSTDVPLSAAGVELARSRAGSAGYPDISDLRVYTSGMLRAEQTLNLLYGNVPHFCDNRFREMDFGAFEMYTYDELCKMPEYIKWLENDFMRTPCPGGESGSQMAARAVGGAREVISGGDALVLCHGGVISAIMNTFFPGEGRDMYQWQPSSAEGYTVYIENSIPVSYERIPE